MYFSRLTAVYEMSNLIKETTICLEFFFPLEMCVLVLNCVVVLFLFTGILLYLILEKSTKSIFPVAD